MPRSAAARAAIAPRVPPGAAQAAPGATGKLRSRKAQTLELLAREYHSLPPYHHRRDALAAEILYRLRPWCRQLLLRACQGARRRARVELEDWQQDCAEKVLWLLARYYDPARGPLINLVTTSLLRLSWRSVGHALDVQTAETAVDLADEDTAWWAGYPGAQASGPDSHDAAEAGILHGAVTDYYRAQRQTAADLGRPADLAGCLAAVAAGLYERTGAPPSAAELAAVFPSGLGRRARTRARQLQAGLAAHVAPLLAS